MKQRTCNMTAQPASARCGRGEGRPRPVDLVGRTPEPNELT